MYCISDVKGYCIPQSFTGLYSSYKASKYPSHMAQRCDGCIEGVNICASSLKVAGADSFHSSVFAGVAAISL